MMTACWQITVEYWCLVGVQETTMFNSVVCFVLLNFASGISSISRNDFTTYNTYSYKTLGYEVLWRSSNPDLYTTSQELSLQHPRLESIPQRSLNASRKWYAHSQFPLLTISDR